MQITQIIQGVHNPSAGPTYSVARLADELCALGEDASILTLGRAPRDWPHRTPLRIHGGTLERKTGLSLSLIREVQALSRSSCILHGHGIWRLTNLFPLFLSRNGRARIVLSPRGMLSPWSMQYKSGIKLPFWLLLQKPALARAHCFHVTAPLEYEDIRRLGLPGPVAVIPNGVDLPNLPKNTPRAKRVVFLSRIDPKKGLELLLPAWTAVAAQFRDWELVIAGPLDSPYAKSIQKVAKNLNSPRVQFIGEVLGEAKLHLLASASLFVLPTYSENFGIAVAEALAHGIPVITTTETPWTEIDRRESGWCIKPEQGQLEETLRNAMSLPLAALHHMGMNGRKWIESDYDWKHIARLMRQTYEWLFQNCHQPSCVIKE